ncbi:MAG TPA: phosphoribosylamine--glycine ligase [Thermomicrobiaceae bacterium]|nr:phosphoribosylamine--glycine ligase [Thermomicrobiaceae bacterium]
MRVLVVGSGAREHALAWKLVQSPRLEALFVAPGNAGTAAVGTNLPIAANEVEALADAAERHAIDLTVIGPEEPLARGIVDRFRERGRRVVGPTADAARIESSKVWAKEVMAAAGVATARSGRYTDLDAALDAVADAPLPIVVKASGLAAGKGVVVAETRGEAEQAVRSMLDEGALGEAGREILIEEYLSGREVSLLALTDGTTTYPLIPACDYKRAGEGDAGPNTGGMGAYAPVPAVDAGAGAGILHDVIEPTLAEIAHRGRRYQGVLYAGMILTSDGPKVLEFNCRFGDPEAEVILPLLDADLLDLLDATADGRLAAVAPPTWHAGTCVGVVLTSGGYPGAYQTGRVIHGLDRLPEDVVAFHAGTRREPDGTVVTSGGRVLTLVARGADFAAARRRVYEAAATVTFDGAAYRRDIAAREERG